MHFACFSYLGPVCSVVSLLFFVYFYASASAMCPRYYEYVHPCILNVVNTVS